jgi:hypothetical protein
MKKILLGILSIAALAYGYFQFSKEGGVTSPSSAVSDYLLNSSGGIKTYSATGFSFQYDGSATVKVQSYSTGAHYYDVSKTGTANEQIKLLSTTLTPYGSYCGTGVETHTTVLRGKSMVYCDKAEQGRVYFYSKNGKVAVITTMKASNGHMYSYIIPESVEIN